MLRYLLCASVSLKQEPFEAIAKERLRKILATRPAREELTAVLLNVGKGSRATTEVRLRNGKPDTKVKEELLFEPVTSKSYEMVRVEIGHGQTAIRRRFRSNLGEI